MRIMDSMIAIMDTVDAGFTHEWLDNIRDTLGSRKPDFLIVQHMEPDHSANILQFAKMSEVNMIYYEKDYYAIPEAGAEKAYELLRQALLSEKKVAIAKTVMGTNEKLLVLYPMKDGMIVKTLFYNDEIASVPKQVPKMKLEEQELEMAKLLIQNMTKAFDAEEYRDEYQARLRDAIMKKIQGQEIVTADTSGPDNVIDLMEALKKSLDMTKKDPSGSKNKRGTA